MSKPLATKRMEKVFVIHEYKHEVLLEEAFEPMKQARLSRYRLKEIEDYIKETETLDKDNWGYLFQKKKWCVDRFIELEKKMGINKEPEKYEDFTLTNKSKTAKEMIDIIISYLKVNADMEEVIERLLEKIVKDLKAKININLEMLDNQLSAMEFHRELKTQRIYQLNNVHTDWDKQVTYLIKTKTKEFSSDINSIPKEERMIKVKDYSFRIEKLYEEIAACESTLLKIHEGFVSNAKVKQIEKSNDIQNQINKKLFLLTSITLGFVVIQTVIGILGLL
ncbi:hypothetical protein [Cytobacillus firmus]|uniref:hypothetical protein n=1 Tax=Cytobacillus firmus TaxID=1399 RepID=UPI001CFF1B09|nr:hypothetical protein [Cytobacillus firmus]